MLAGITKSENWQSSMVYMASIPGEPRLHYGFIMATVKLCYRFATTASLIEGQVLKLSRSISITDKSCIGKAYSLWQAYIRLI